MKEQIVDINTIEAAFESSELNHSEVRKAAMQAFSKVGFPTHKSENWKYANLQKILKRGYTPVTAYDAGELEASAYESFKVSKANNNKLVFVDGKFNPALSQVVETAGLRFSLLSESAAFAIAPNSEDSLLDLNTAFALDGALISIDAKAVIEAPIEIYNITTCPGLKIIQPKHQIKVGKFAEVTFVESYHNLCVGSSFTNAAIDIQVEENAVVNYIKLQHPKKQNTFVIDHTNVEQAQNSTFNIYTYTLSGGLVRNNLQIVLNGEFTTTNMYGLSLLQGEETADNFTIVDHAKPNCYSNELYKGIYNGKSTGNFSGKIIVREQAQKTNAYQNNRNILVSDDATVNTRPQLEIYADDVKCSHGATSAQIEDSELFYLRARGIGKEKAKSLLMYAFAAETWESIKNDDLRNYIGEMVAHALKIEL